MQICDKCHKRKVEKNLKMDKKDYELCSECYNKIARWLDTPGEGIMNIFGGNY